MPTERIWELLTKKLNNEISLQELDELEMLLRESQDAFQLNEILNGFGELSFKPVTDNAMRQRSVNAIKDAIGSDVGHDNKEEWLNQEAENAGSRIRKNKMRIGLGALTCAALIVAIVYLPFNKKNKDDRDEGIVVNEIKTGAGSKTTINLPDGSVVVLNAGSKLSYNKEFGITSRRIKLTGEAYFDIRKNPAMPLVVHAGTVDIWVMGTTFNVKAYPKDSTVEAALLTGIIELVSQKDPERKILLRPNEKIVVSRSTIAPLPSSSDNTATRSEETISLGKMIRNPADSSYAEIAWLQNKLVFRSESFASLAKKMEQRYDVTIQFSDEQMSELIFTGSFIEETLPEALEALKSTVPFHYTIQNKTVFIRK